MQPATSSPSSAPQINWDSIVRFPAGRVEDAQRQATLSQLLRFLEKSRPLDSLSRHKPHLLMPAAYDLGQSPAILQGVREFLGTDEFFLWYSVLFIKEKHTAGYIPWHYDDYFWGLYATNGCTAWVALEEVTAENGAMEFAAGAADAAKLFVQFESNNMLVRGNNSTFAPQPGDEVKTIALKAGEFSVHSNAAWHRSGPNTSPNDRLAIAFRFITDDAALKKFKFLQRGGVARQGRKLPRGFYAERKPSRELKAGESWQHKKSILISALLTSFGDANRGFLEQLRDFLLMMKSSRFFKLFATMLGALLGKGSTPNTKNINEG